MKQFTAQLAFPCRATLGEGSIWDPVRQQLLWVDIYDDKVFVFDPRSSSNTAYAVGSNVGTVVPTEQGLLLVALRNQLALLSLETGQVRPVLAPSKDRPGAKIRFNDGKCDPEGRFWVGTMVENGPKGLGVLYKIDSDLQVTEVLHGLTISNGLVWHEERFYHIDTPTQQVRCYHYDRRGGQLGEPTVAASFADTMGAPDGMCLDAEGLLWVALFGGGAVVRIDPKTGETMCRVDVAASNATSCAFGGRDLNELYITTARIGLSDSQAEAEPLAGSLFRVKLPYQGVPSSRFAGA